MDEKERNELRRLATEMSDGLPWRVQKLLGKFEIKDRKGKTVIATTSTCRFIELAVASSMEEKEPESKPVEKDCEENSPISDKELERQKESASSAWDAFTEEIAGKALLWKRAENDEIRSEDR